MKPVTYRNNLEIGRFRKFDTEYETRKDFLAFYTRVFDGQLRPRKWPYYTALCPFHDDCNTPNLSINVISGYYKCFACGAWGGYWDFIVSRNNSGALRTVIPGDVTDTDTLEKITEYKKRVTEPDELDLAMEENRGERAQEFLRRNPLELRGLRNRGLTLETIHKWGLGFIQGAISIPIPGKNGKLAALKAHKQWVTEGARNQLFPWGSVMYNRKSYVVVVEGEFDMMLARQMGINAVTQIFGANSWDTDFNSYFRGKTVYILYDNDEAGRTATGNLAYDLWKSRVSVRVPQWPSFMQDKEDHTDYFIKYQQTPKNYWAVLDRAVGVTDYFKKNKEI